MKTAFDFLKEKNGSDTFLRHNQEEYIRLKDAQEAMKAYAEQAIDRCAATAEIDGMLASEGVIGINRSSILNVKQELK